MLVQSFKTLEDITNRDVMFTMETAQLIERCKQGDADALGELYKAYAQRMRGVCRRYIHDEQTAEDVLHDAFVIIFTSFDKLRDTSKAEAWMMSITRNVASKYKDHLNALPTIPLEDAAAVTMTEEDERKDVRGVPLEEVVKLIGKLPEGYGKVFRLSVFEGLSHKEIAGLLGIEAHSSSSQLVRAKRMLRGMMQRYWALLLLLLIPAALLLFKRNAPSPVVPEIGHEKTPREKETHPVSDIEKPNLAQKEPSHPFKTHLPAKHDTLQKVTVYTTDSVIPVDTVSRIIAEKEPADTIQKMETDSMQPSLPRYDIAETLPEQQIIRNKEDKQWSLELAYAGMFGNQSPTTEPYSYTPYFDPSRQSSPISGETPAYTVPSSIDNWSDYAIYLANNPDAVNPRTRSFIMRIALNNANQPGEDKIIRKSHHQLPVTWSLALKYRLNHRWGFETGLGYSKLTSDFEMGDNGNKIEEHQTVHYLGIPAKALYHLYGGKSWNLYGSAGVVMDVPLYAPVKSKFYVNGNLEGTDKMNVRAPWQFSTTFGLGLQYHITPTIGLFAEPSLQYYIPTGSGIETYRTEHPFSFTLPLGIRFTW